MSRAALVTLCALITVLLAAGVAVVVFVSGASTGTEVLSSDFNGPAGSAPGAPWRPVTGASGWGNDELECYTADRDNAEQDGAGHLVITARHESGHICADGAPSDYTSARLTTLGTLSVTHGRLEIRAKVPTARGTWPAFWALGTDAASVGWPKSGEIDVFETNGDSNIWYGSVHGPTTSGAAWGIVNSCVSGTSLGTRFHTYAVTWSADAIRFAIDGAACATVSRAQVERRGEWVFDKPFYLLVNLAIGGTFTKSPDAHGTWPQQYVIDWVHVYRDSD